MAKRSARRLRLRRALRILLLIALLGSVAFVGTAVAVNVYRRRIEGAEELGAE